MGGLERKGVQTAPGEGKKTESIGLAMRNLTTGPFFHRPMGLKFCTWSVSSLHRILIVLRTVRIFCYLHKVAGGAT